MTYTGQKEDSFEDAEQTLKKYLDIDVSSTQIQIISEKVGKLLFDKDMTEANRICNETYGDLDYKEVYKQQQEHCGLTNKSSMLYIFADGSMLSMKGASNWKEIKLGLVVRGDDVCIKSEENMVLYKKEYVSYLGNKDEFKKLLFAAAVKAGYNSNMKVVAIADGASWIWTMFEELFPGCVKILDFYHFSENVHKYATFAYPEDEVSRKRWVNNIFDLAYANNVDEILDEITKIRKVEIKLPKGVVNLHNYISDKRDMINYKEFKNKGYIIGSGAIESGNKLVIQRRLKQSGMHWSTDGAQYIAKLRTKYKSDMWYKVLQCIDEDFLVG